MKLNINLFTQNIEILKSNKLNITIFNLKLYKKDTFAGCVKLMI